MVRRRVRAGLLLHSVERSSCDGLGSWSGTMRRREMRLARQGAAVTETVKAILRSPISPDPRPVPP